MTRRATGSILFAAGCVVGMALPTLFGGGEMQAVAQPAEGVGESAEAHGDELGHGDAGVELVSDARYRISSWGSDNNHGAYLINTQTGEVWSVVQGSPLQAHGRPTPKDAN